MNYVALTCTLTYINSSGDIVPIANQVVSVTKRASGETASVYSSDTGGTTYSQVTTDASGNLNGSSNSYFVEEGSYIIGVPSSTNYNAFNVYFEAVHGDGVANLDPSVADLIGDVSGALPNTTVNTVLGGHNPGVYLAGTLAARPTSGMKQGTLYWATDTGTIYISNGSTWYQFAISGRTGYGGDLYGTMPNPTVTHMQGLPIAGGTPSQPSMFGWNGSEFTPMYLTPIQVSSVGSPPALASNWAVPVPAGARYMLASLQGGGGGGGAGGAAGGGGGGQFVQAMINVQTSGAIRLTIGAGGAGHSPIGGAYQDVFGESGGNTVISGPGMPTITAYGGGGGQCGDVGYGGCYGTPGQVVPIWGNYNDPTGSISASMGNGGAGGIGGGTGGNPPTYAMVGGAGVGLGGAGGGGAGLGSAGGRRGGTGTYGNGGGGGTAAPGGNATGYGNGGGGGSAGYAGGNGSPGIALFEFFV